MLHGTRWDCRRPARAAARRTAASGAARYRLAAHGRQPGRRADPHTRAARSHPAIQRTRAVMADATGARMPATDPQTSRHGRVAWPAYAAGAGDRGRAIAGSPVGAGATPERRSAPG